MSLIIPTRIPHLPRHYLEKVGHFHSRHGGIESFVARLGTGPFNSLFNIVSGDQSIDYRHAAVQAHLGYTLSYLGSHILKMGGSTANDRPQANNGIVAPGGHLLRCQGYLKGSRHPGNINGARVGAVAVQGIQGSIQEPGSDKLVETADNYAKL
ncbi:ATPase [Moorella thermoacetica Y72]|uniref:ATPase n=1 Tax=Moorella thermoacetica Y72 TaxID=1325331 RepID=A0A0S6UGK1_NEOTH|nr:ATPase [Moorella thermoacetica Y72]